MSAYFQTGSFVPICPVCRSQYRQTKAGRTVYGDQRYQCQDCKRYYAAQNRRYRYPLPLRRQAIQLHGEGLSLRQIAHRLSVNHQTIRNWIQTDNTALQEHSSGVEMPEETDCEQSAI
jgi:transposase-like protein